MDLRMKIRECNTKVGVEFPHTGGCCARLGRVVDEIVGEELFEDVEVVLAFVVFCILLEVIDVLGVDGTKLRVGTKEDGYDLADFDWMDAWQVQPRRKLMPSELNSAAVITQMAGEGIMVEKTEAASALVYWDGKKFRWYQMSD